MNILALYAALGVCVIALPAFFLFGRRGGIAAGQKIVLERQAAAEAPDRPRAKARD